MYFAEGIEKHERVYASDDLSMKCSCGRFFMTNTNIKAFEIGFNIHVIHHKKYPTKVA